jgi:tRNA-specific adenosine deaminase 1
MKCLPHAKLPRAQGNVLHDWHAEVLAIRAFNRFVLDEARRLASSTSEEPSGAASSPFLRWRDASEMQQQQQASNEENCQEQQHGSEATADITTTSATPTTTAWNAQPFAWRDDVTLHMYCSEAPCGDASMELTMAAQDDASPWEIPTSLLPSSAREEGGGGESVLSSSSAALSTTAATTSPPQQQQEEENPGPLPGRAYFSRLGAVRLKPSRADAPPTLSKSCSDKLAHMQCTSLLGSLASLLVCPSRGLYLESVVLPRSQLSATGCRRAFSGRGSSGSGSGSGGGDGGDVGRMAAVMENRRSEKWQGGYRFREFRVDATDLEFKWSKRSVEARVGVGADNNNMKGKLAASNLAVAWTAHGLEEATLGGTLQGRKAFDIKGASFASRRKLWSLSLEIAGLLGHGMMQAKQALMSKTYGEVKRSNLLQARRRVKEHVRAGALRGWAKNHGDDGFSL